MNGKWAKYVVSCQMNDNLNCSKSEFNNFYWKHIMICISKYAEDIKINQKLDNSCENSLKWGWPVLFIIINEQQVYFISRT